MSSSKRPTRIDLCRPATVINADGDTLTVTILDISSAGFRIQVFEPLHEGELVRLSEGPHFMNAQIKWCLGNEAGGVFIDDANEAT